MGKRRAYFTQNRRKTRMKRDKIANFGSGKADYPQPLCGALAPAARA
jgi:hypothetical protein